MEMKYHTTNSDCKSLTEGLCVGKSSICFKFKNNIYIITSEKKLNIGE